MDFKVHDQVVHYVFGPGEIIQYDEKEVAGQVGKYYIVQTNDLLLWVPVADTGRCSLRFITPRNEFEKLFEILSSQGEEISEDRLVRKTQMTERLKEGDLASVCKVIRDMTWFGHKKRLNDYDSAILERAENFLLNEWVIAFSITHRQAEQEMREMLKGS